MPSSSRKIRGALVQFDVMPEAVPENRDRMSALVSRAVADGARWVMFHEGTVCDYTPRLAELAELVPAGASIQAMMELARSRDCVISFGLSETADGPERFEIDGVRATYGTSIIKRGDWKR